MNYEEKIQELEERISKLERIEKKRRNEKITKIVLKLIAFILVIALLIFTYKLVRPYFDEIKDLSELKNSFNEGGNFIKEQIDTLTNN